MTNTKNTYGYTYGQCVCGHPIDATGTECGSEQYDGFCPGEEPAPAGPLYDDEFRGLTGREV